MTLYEKLKEDLLTARKIRNQPEITVVGILIGELDNAAAVEVDVRQEMVVNETLSYTTTQVKEVPRKRLDEAEIRAIIQAYSDELSALIEHHASKEAWTEVSNLQAQRQIARRYLT